MLNSLQLRAVNPLLATENLDGDADSAATSTEPAQQGDFKRHKVSHTAPQSDPKKPKSGKSKLQHISGYEKLTGPTKHYVEYRLRDHSIDIEDPSFLCLPDEHGHFDPSQQHANLTLFFDNLQHGSPVRSVRLLTNIMASPHFTPLQKVFFCCGQFKPDEVLTIFLEARRNPRNRVWVDDVLRDLTLTDYETHIPHGTKHLGNPDALWRQAYQELVCHGHADLVDGLDATHPNWMGVSENMIDREIDIYHHEPNREIKKVIWWLIDEWLKANDHVKPAWQIFMDQEFDSPHKLRELAKASIMNLHFFLSDQRGLNSKEKRDATAKELEELRGKTVPLTCNGLGTLRTGEFHWATIASIARKTGLQAVIDAFDTDEEFALALARQSYANYEARALLAALYPHRPIAVKRVLAAVYDDNEKIAKKGNLNFYPLIRALVDAYPYEDDTARNNERRTWHQNDEPQPDSECINQALEKIKKQIEVLQSGLYGDNITLPNVFLGVACNYLETHGFFPSPHTGPREFGLSLLVDRMAIGLGIDRNVILAKLLPDTTVAILPETEESIELRSAGPRPSRFEFMTEEDREPQIFQKILSFLKYPNTVSGVEKNTDLVAVSASERSPFSDSGPLPIFQITPSAPNIHMPEMLIETIDLRINGGRLRSEVVHGLLTPAEKTKLDATLTITRVDSDEHGDEEKIPIPSYGKRVGAVYDSDKVTVAVPTTEGVTSSVEMGSLMERFLPRSLSSALLGRGGESHYDSAALDSWEHYYASLDKGFNDALVLEVGSRHAVTPFLPEKKFKTPRDAINFVIRFIRDNIAYDHDLDDDVTHRQFQDDYERGKLDANELWDHLFDANHRTQRGKVRVQCREIAFIATQLLRASGIVTAYQNGRLVKPNGRTTKLGHTHPAVILSGRDNKPRIAFFHFAAGETIGTNPFPDDDTDEIKPNLWPLGMAAGAFGITTFSGLCLGISSIVPVASSPQMAGLAPSALGLAVVAAIAMGAIILGQRHHEKNDDKQKPEEILLEESGMKIPMKIKRGTLGQVHSFIHRYHYLTDTRLERYLADLSHGDLPASLDQTLANFFPRRIRVPKTNRTSTLYTPEFIRKNTVKRRDEMARLLDHATRPLTTEERKEIAREIAQLEYDKEKTRLNGDILQRNIETLQEILRQNSLLNPQATRIVRSLIEQDRDRPSGWLPEVVTKP